MLLDQQYFTFLSTSRMVFNSLDTLLATSLFVESVEANICMYPILQSKLSTYIMEALRIYELGVDQGFLNLLFSK